MSGLRSREMCNTGKRRLKNYMKKYAYDHIYAVISKSLKKGKTRLIQLAGKK